MSEVRIDEKWYEVPDPVIQRMQENYDAMVSASQKQEDLKAAVQDMRDKQRLYFKSPKAFNLLDDAKAAEKVVDGLLSGKPAAVNSSQVKMF